jgi:AraC family transcriptional regulator, transcriptional activator of pobA
MYNQKTTKAPTAKKKPTRYGLYGEGDFLLPDFMHCETIAYRSKIHNYSIKEHIHSSLFQVFIIEAGELHITIEHNHQSISGPAIITIPENTLHGFTVGKNIVGKVLTLSSSFLELFFTNSPQALFEFSKPRVVTEFDETKSFSSTSFFVDNLYKEINQELPEKKMVLQCYFNLLLSLTYRLLKKTFERISLPDNRNIRYFTLFQKSIKNTYLPMKTVKEYASELKITSVHLNRICQATAGKAASHIIRDFFILEAEQYLNHTDMQVAEIAYLLNFEDPAYFSRFFKKNTGLSPKQFRENK